MIAVMISLAVLLFASRLRMLQRLWQLPLKNGEGFFLAQQVPPDFYRAAGARLFHSYHASVLAALVLDAPLAIWLALANRYLALSIEQLLMLVISGVFYNFIAVYFSSRATALCGSPPETQVTSLQLSMAPRRLRDYTIPAVEGVIVVATLLALALLARSYMLSLSYPSNHFLRRAFRAGVLLNIWVLYWQAGFLLLKGVFVRWRMPLPAKRTEDFRRWRTAWLRHSLRIFDAVRVLCAVSLLGAMSWLLFGHQWPGYAKNVVLALAALGTLFYGVYVTRQRRRLAATERELRPVEMAKEFPRWPVAEGHYLAGGLLYFNPDNPRVLVRSAQGVALNLAHRTIHIGAVYFAGLIALAIWMAKLTH